jgi:uncharacterized phiE125 gp8 family phage protein
MALNANALTTLAQAKSYLKIPSGVTSDDALVELFINAASADLERDCDRLFKAQTITEYQDGKGHNAILLREWPLNSITEVRVDAGSDFTDADTLLDADEYRIHDEENALIRVNALWPKGYRNIKIIYNAGFATIPADLEHAVLWIVTWYYKIRNAEDIGRSTKSKEGETVSYSQEMPKHILNIVDKYKRCEFFASTAGTSSS